MKMKKNSRILIVGHNDIIEKSLFQYFKNNGYLSVISSSDIALDTTIQTSVYHFFSEYKPEFIFLSSIKSGGIKANQENPAEFIYSNLESQNNIIYSSNKFGVKKLLFIASSCIYPKECNQPMKEEYIGSGKMEETSEPYSIAKLAGIKLCQSFNKQFKLNAISMIPATVYGPNIEKNIENSHVMGALISKFAIAVRDKKNDVDIWGTGKPRREFLFSDDFVDACLFLMDKYDDPEVINVGCGYDVSIKELAEIIAYISGFNGNIKFDISKPDGSMKKLLDISKVRKLGWQSKVQLKKGIEKTYNDYFRKEGFNK